jgi:hypothetical protein
VANACSDAVGASSSLQVEVYRGRSGAVSGCEAVSTGSAREFNLAVIGIRAPAYAR